MTLSNRSARIRSATLLAPALAALLPVRVAALEPPPFSGANCSMTTCDCACIASEEKKGAAELERLAVALPSSLTTKPARLSPTSAISKVQMLMTRLDTLRFALEVHTQDPLGVGRANEIRSRFSELLARFDIPPAPPGWEPGRYLEAVDRSARSELQQLAFAAANEAAVQREINTCQRWADQKQCDPSLGEPRHTPLREMPPAPPPVVTPPREFPPDGPLPIGRHADGRPYVNDELISRYVAASQAKRREGGAYWRQGRMGQADYDEISSRIQEFFRYENGPEIYQRFDNTEITAITRRRAEVNKAYYEDW